MRRLIARFLCAVLLVSLATVKAPGGDNVKAAETYDGTTIRIKVVNEKGKPVKGLELYLESDYKQGNLPFYHVTDKNGSVIYDVAEANAKGDIIMEGDSYYLQPVEESGYSCEDSIEVIFEDWGEKVASVGAYDPYNGEEIVLTVKGKGGSEPETSEVDKFALEDVIQKAEKLKAEDYTADSYKAVEEALADARKVLKDEAASEEDVEKSTEKLQKAIDGLEEKESVPEYDGTQLNVRVVDQKDKPIEGLQLYLESQEFGDELEFDSVTDEKGQAVFTSSDADVWSQDTYKVCVDAEASYKYEGAIMVTFERKIFEMHIAAVNGKAYDGSYIEIQVQGNDDASFKEDLKKLVEEAEALKAGDYTEDSYKAVEEALADAKKLLEDGAAKEEAVKAAAEALQKALDELVKAEADIPIYHDIEAYQQKDFYETETVKIPGLAVQDATDEKNVRPFTGEAEFVIFNSTLQKVENRVVSKNGTLPELSLIKNHNYTIWVEDADYSMETELYVWVKDGEIVDIKDTTLEWNKDQSNVIDKTTYNYPKVDSIQIMKRESPVEDPSEDRRSTAFLDILHEAGGVLKNQKIKLVSEYETIELTNGEQNKIYPRLLEDVNYMVLVESDNFDILSYPLVIKDKSEYRDPNHNPNFLGKNTYDHSDCQAADKIQLVSKGQGHKYDTVLTSFSGRTTVTGLNFKDLLLMEKEVDKSRVTGLEGKDYDVLEITTINPHRWEICKLAAGEFQVTERITENKGVEAVYYLDAEGALQPLEFKQNGKNINFTMNSLALYPVVIEYNEEEAPVVPPTITGGSDGVWVKGSENGLTFRSDADLEDFVRVLVDEEVLDADNYTKSAGSTVITLKADYLATLSAGSHIVEIESKNGIARANFTIQEEEQESKPNPNPSPTPGLKPDSNTDPNVSVDDSKANVVNKTKVEKAGAATTSAAKTGDEAPIAGFVVLMLASMGAIVMIAGKKYKILK